MTDSFGNSFAMSRFAGMSAEQVQRDIGNFFLVIQGKQQPTIREQDDDTSEVNIATEPSPQPTRGLVYLVAKKPTSTFAWVSVGRHENNDVWMPHASVSRFHAMLREEKRAWLVQDAKTANGTFIANVPVKAHGTGDAAPLHTGQEIRFGDIITLFLDAAGIVSLATRTRSRGPMPGLGST